jgi:hypothetical protein
LLATKWVNQFGNIIGNSNTLVLNENLNDPSSVIAKAMAVMGSFNTNQTTTTTTTNKQQKE